MPGFTRPFTPEGRASIVPALPWKFASDLLLVHFRADPDALAAILPAPLEPPRQLGEAFLWSPHLVTAAEDGDRTSLNPAQTHYNVAVIGIPCRLNGVDTMFSAFQWCDRDWLVVLSWFLGACSKMAEFETTGRHPMFAGTDGSDCAGSLIRRSVCRHGEQVLSLSFSPEEETTMQDLEFYTQNLPLTSMRHVPDVHVPKRGRPELHDLTQMVMSDVRFGTPTRGTASLQFGDSMNEELLPIQPTEVLGGFTIPMAFNLEGIKVVHNYLKE